jgi:hypothetical protein
VYFFHGILSSPAIASAQIQITGGVRIPGSAIGIVSLTPATDLYGTIYLQIELTEFGDKSDYFLTINDSRLDPFFNCRRFNFAVNCPNPLDCPEPVPAPPPAPPGPGIDYLVKDYKSFRRALLAFLPSRVPGFTETNEADLAVTLAELFAYAGDQLSYFQDAVSNEAYFMTARQRQSVKRHAMLVDYRMHEGLAARTLIHFGVAASVLVPVRAQIHTNDSDPSRQLFFETEEAVQCYVVQNKIQLYNWRGALCCLPAGSTSADLQGSPTSLNLAIGQLLVFEEFLGSMQNPDGSTSLVASAADPARRQAVRVTCVCVAPVVDPLAPPNTLLTRVTWGAVDALTQDFCLQADSNGQVATIARGNLARASHGQTINGEVFNPSSPTLAQGPLTWLDPIDTPSAPLTWLVPPDVADPRQALSTVSLTVNGDVWQEQQSLLDSEANDPDFVVDVDNNGRGVLRFGDGQLGRSLPPFATFVLTYRVGNGSIGNVSADSLTQFPGAPSGVTLARNPLPGVGGTDPEPVEDVRRDAPQEFRAVQFRAVTAQDYANAALSVAGVADAQAVFRWTGSWLTVFTALDAVGRDGLPAPLKAAVTTRLESRRQAGYDLDVNDPVYVALKITLHICVDFNYYRADVQAAVSDALCNGYRLNGGLGFFYPGNFTFGQPLYLSALYAAVQAIPGVLGVHARVFKRLHEPAQGELAAGELTVASSEIVRLDNNPSQPDFGVLKLDMDGGK